MYKMGNVQAQTSKQVASAFTDVVNKVTADAVANANLDAASFNNISLSTCPSFQLINGNLTINQNASSNFKLTLKNLQDISATIKTSVSTAISSWITQNEQNYQGWLGFAFSAQVAGAETVDSVSNFIANSITSNADATCQGQVIIDNNVNVILCGFFKDSDIIVNQSTQLNAAESCINQQIQKVFLENNVVSQIVQKTDQHFLSQQSGFGDFLYLIIGAAVVILIILVIAGIYSHYSSSQNKFRKQEEQDRMKRFMIQSNLDDVDSNGQNSNGLNYNGINGNKLNV
jgi:hypothetical protein